MDLRNSGPKSKRSTARWLPYNISALGRRTLLVFSEFNVVVLNDARSGSCGRLVAAVGVSRCPIRKLFFMKRAELTALRQEWWNSLLQEDCLPNSGGNLICCIIHLSNYGIYFLIFWWLADRYEGWLILFVVSFLCFESNFLLCVSDIFALLFIFE